MADLLMLGFVPQPNLRSAQATFSPAFPAGQSVNCIARMGA